MRAVLTRSKSNDIGLVGRAIHGITLPLVAVHIKGKNTTNANRWLCGTPPPIGRHAGRQVVVRDIFTEIHDKPVTLLALWI